MSDALAIQPPWAAGRRSAFEGRKGSAFEGRRDRQERRAQHRARHLAALSAMSEAGTPDQGSDGGTAADRPTRRGGDERKDDRRSDRGRGRPGGPGSGGPGFGGPPMRGRRGRGGGRAKRGDVRAAILTLLGENPTNGYSLIQEIEERSSGVWKPSPGAIYPALQQLEDEGLIRPVEIEDRKLFELTATGREHLDQSVGTTPPWEAVTSRSGVGMRDAKHQLAQVWHAYAAVLQDGTPQQVEAASKVVTDAKRSLYRILAEDEENAG